MGFDERIRIRLESDTKDLIEDVADRRGVPASTLARQILRTGIKQVAQGEDPAQLELGDSE